MDKVRYFRDLLTTEERKPQIILASEIKPLLEMAIADYKDVAVNQVVVIYPWTKAPTLAVKGRTNDSDPILIYVRFRRDEFLDALKEEHWGSDIVVFEPDPIHVTPT
jgi:hypothetical protein